MTAAINLPTNQKVKSVPASWDFEGFLTTYRSDTFIQNHNRKEAQYSGQHPNRRAVLLCDWHGHGVILEDYASNILQRQPLQYVFYCHDSPFGEIIL